MCRCFDIQFCFTINSSKFLLQGYTGASSDDALSSGDEFYENEKFEFMRPSEEAMLQSIPIVPTQKASTCIYVYDGQLYAMLG